MSLDCIRLRASENATMGVEIHTRDRRSNACVDHAHDCIHDHARKCRDATMGNWLAEHSGRTSQEAEPTSAADVYAGLVGPGNACSLQCHLPVRRMCVSDHYHLDH